MIDVHLYRIWIALTNLGEVRHQYRPPSRYPEQDTIQNVIIQFGNYLEGEQSTRGGFLPIFWDAPDSYIHASTDIGEFENKLILRRRVRQRRKIHSGVASSMVHRGPWGAVLNSWDLAPCSEECQV